MTTMKTSKKKLNKILIRSGKVPFCTADYGSKELMYAYRAWTPENLPKGSDYWQLYKAVWYLPKKIWNYKKYLKRRK